MKNKLAIPPIRDTDLIVQNHELNSFCHFILQQYEKLMLEVMRNGAENLINRAIETNEQLTIYDDACEMTNFLGSFEKIKHLSRK